MFFPSFSRAGALGLKKWTSNSCTADKENPRKSEAETMYVPHNARYSVGAQAPNVPLAGLTLYQLSYWLALVFDNLFSNVLTYFFYGCAATNPFLHVLREKAFQPVLPLFWTAVLSCLRKHYFHILNWEITESLQNPHHVRAFNNDSRLLWFWPSMGTSAVRTKRTACRLQEGGTRASYLN